MLIGHYAPALVIKRASPRAPMWALFLACQIMDVFWAVFIGTGIERAHVDESRAAMPIVLDYMPYTHSLLGAAVLSFGLAAIVADRVKRDWRNVFIWVGVAGVSHWVLDLLVHYPDLTLFGRSPYFGFALWRYVWPEFWAEIAMLVAGMAYYVRLTQPNGPIGRFAPWVVAAVMIAVFYLVKTMPTPTDVKAGAVSALAIYIPFALLGLWLDRVRKVKAT